MLKLYSGDRPTSQLFDLMMIKARMGEHSFENVTGELEGSGLLDLMYPQYRMLLRCMAEMADACGGKEFPATHSQIAKRSGGDRHGSMTPELAAELVFDFIRLGIVEVAPASGPVTYRKGAGKEEWRRVSRDERTMYRFGSYDRFVEMAEEIRRLQGNDDASLLPPVVPQSSRMRAEQ
ncbi:MAG: hypothetical protein OXI52_09025 [Caldilineaceae bacterium]|nr:hypothetical protein [Caldilineaceae bacterium]